MGEGMLHTFGTDLSRKGRNKYPHHHPFQKPNEVKKITRIGGVLSVCLRPVYSAGDILVTVNYARFKQANQRDGLCTLPQLDSNYYLAFNFCHEEYS